MSSTSVVSKPRRSMAWLVVRIGIYVLLGMPLVGYLWSTVSEVLALRFDPIRLFAAVPVIGILFVLLTLLSWSVRDWLNAAD